MSAIVDIVNTGGSLLTGNWVAAAASFLNIFKGHSMWWKADKAVGDGNWPAAAAFFKVLYTTPKENGGNHDKAGFDGDLKGDLVSDVLQGKYTGKRYSLIPIIYKNTKDPAMLEMYQLAIQKGLLAPDPAILGTTPNTGTVAGSVPAQTVIDNVLPAANNTATQPYNTGGTQNNAGVPGVPPATNNTKKYLTYGAVAAGVVALVVVIILLVKKK